jgi:5-methylcytosine-specific restriction endonuclease McrA
MARKNGPARERRRALDLSKQHARAQLVRVYRRDQGICQLCELPCAREDASREHRIPLRDGGSNDDGNVVLAHKLCNGLADQQQQTNLRTYTSQSDGWED